MNVHELRYRILKEYYDAFFTDDVALRFTTILNILKEHSLIPKFVVTNTFYLLAYKYIIQQGSEYVITARGIKFIENFTRGYIQYQFKNEDLEWLTGLFAKYNAEITPYETTDLESSFSEQVDNSTKPKKSNRKGHP